MRPEPLAVAGPQSASEAFAELDVAFARAAREYAALVKESFYTFADRTVRIRVVGHALAADIDLPFAHLRRAPAPPQLTIDLVDAAETNTPCRLRTADIWRGHVSCTGDGRFIAQEKGASKNVFDRRDQRIVGIVAQRDRRTINERGRPLHLPLLLWHQDREVHAVHAGLVAHDGAAALIGGPGGAGKSTVSLTCLHAGLSYLSDDYVALEERQDGVYVGHSLYASAHLEAHHLGRFKDLQERSLPPTLPEEDKHLFLLHEHCPERLLRRANVRAILMPRVVDAEETVARRATMAETLLRMAPTSVFMVPHAGNNRRGFQMLTRLIEKVPAYWLELGRDLEEIPRRVREILVKEAACGPVR